MDGRATSQTQSCHSALNGSHQKGAGGYACGHFLICHIGKPFSSCFNIFRMYKALHIQFFGLKILHINLYPKPCAQLCFLLLEFFTRSNVMIYWVIGGYTPTNGS